MTEEQLAHLEEVFSGIEEKIDTKLRKIEALQENLITRAAFISDLTEEEIMAHLEHFENSLEEKRQYRADRLREHRDTVKEHRGKTLERIDQRVDLTLEERKLIRERIKERMHPELSPVDSLRDSE